MVLVGGFIIGRKFPNHSSKNSGPVAEPSATMLKSGPWGNLEMVPISIAPPKELLRVQGTTDTTNIAWNFEGYSREQVGTLLESLGIADRQREQMMDGAHLRPTTGGMEMSPSPEFVFSLSSKARLGIYQVLALSSQNSAIQFAVPLAVADTLFEKYGVSKEAVALFKSVSCAYRNHLVCYCLPFVMQKIPAYEARVALYKAIACNQTMLVRMHVTADSDINALNDYWGKACWSTDVKAFLESLSYVKDGTWLDVIELLPPLPTALLYTYPVPQDRSKPDAIEPDCHWTSMNFFRDVPDNHLKESPIMAEKLKTDFFPVGSDPRYGDILLLVTPDNKAIHSAVFLADNIVYTKNGTGALNPWMLSTIDDLVDLYSFGLPPGKIVRLLYFRNKYY